MSNTPTQIEEDEVRVAVRGLLRQANMYSMSHLQDPTLQHQFREEYRFLGQCLLSDYRDGILVGSKIVRLAKQERQSLIDQALELGKYGIGLIAGVGQLSAGYGICVTSSVFSIAGASWCSGVGTPMMTHGGNNIYENSYNITGNIVQNWKGRYTGDYGDSNSFVRKGYRLAAEQMGMASREGDAAYAAVDIATSIYGLKNTLKAVPHANVPNARQFKLFYYSSRDFSKGWRTMSSGALLNETFGNYNTVKDAAKPYLEEEQ
ncbi:DUF4225 domain-containing protein [Vibrio owensii]|uniref:DUF4225 domain-containing protein n=1 Tax=Vibrio owensii TaxID=696485 RepID=UPI000EFBBFBA|nr:DUF4225 domain-containing protein [Vibrio owensii]AYO21059.1 DUF4225 domain-containing protein [Vibrio owensii]